MTDTPASTTVDTLHVTLDAQKTEEVLESCFTLFTGFLHDNDEDRALENISSASVLIFNSFQIDTPVACGKGCSFCCYQPVGINLAEARTIALHLSTLPADIQTDSLKRLKKMNNVPVEKYAPSGLNKRFPCPFLHEDSSCRIYDVRPLSCRRYSSLSVETCKRLYEGDASARHAAIALQRIVADLINQAVYLAVKQHSQGRIQPEYLMSNAVYYIVKERGPAAIR